MKKLFFLILFFLSACTSQKLETPAQPSLSASLIEKFPEATPQTQSTVVPLKYAVQSTQSAPVPSSVTSQPVANERLITFTESPTKEITMIQLSSTQFDGKCFNGRDDRRVWFGIGGFAFIIEKIGYVPIYTTIEKDKIKIFPPAIFNGINGIGDGWLSIIFSEGSMVLNCTEFDTQGNITQDIRYEIKTNPNTGEIYKFETTGGASFMLINVPEDPFNLIPAGRAKGWYYLFDTSQAIPF